jgi:hypothetical protein
LTLHEKIRTGEITQRPVAEGAGERESEPAAGWLLEDPDAVRVATPR